MIPHRCFIVSIGPLHVGTVRVPSEGKEFPTNTEYLAAGEAANRDFAAMREALMEG